MKKVTNAQPNLLLKAERELRGWSQKHVAEQIGADHYYLSRWERGTAFPSPYYRQKLCMLFGKDASELGLQPKKPASDNAASQALNSQMSSTAPVPELAVHDPAIPPPGGNVALVGRDAVLEQLKQRLFDRHHLVLTALNGLPGVGKTALALALAYDREVQAYFHHGILWAGVGPQPNVVGLLSRWGTLLGIAASTATKLTTMAAWAQALRDRIGSRRMLLVIDDAWEIHDALAFKVGGPHCAYLITTRFPGIALQFASDGATIVEELNQQDSIALLTQLAPEVIKGEPHSVQEIVQLVGGLPLALTLIGKYLQTQAYSGQPRRIRAAIERLRNVEMRLQLSEPKAYLERTPSLPQDIPISLQSIIAVSDQQLDEWASGALRALSVFPAKPNSFSEEAALAVCNVGVETLDVLCDAGLLESRGPGRYALHQTIADYARAHLLDMSAYQRLAAYFANFTHAYKNNYGVLEPELANIFASLNAAWQHGPQPALIQMMIAYFSFLDARGLYNEQTETYLERAEDVARALQNTANLITLLLNRGRIAIKKGQYAQAEAYLLEGLSLAQQAEDSERMCEVLTLLGGICIRRGAYAEAEAHLQEGLRLARQIESAAHLGKLLTNLGWGAHVQGKYAQAKAYYEEGLAAVSRVGDREPMLVLQGNLGVIAADQGDLAQAKAYYEEALQSARQLGYLERIGLMLNNLGATAMDQGFYDQAETYFQEGLKVTRQSGDRDQISMLLNNLGETHTARGTYEQAESYFLDSLALSRAIGNAWHINVALNGLGELYLKQLRYEDALASFQELQQRNADGNQKWLASGLYGLARIALAQHNIDEASQQGQLSLSLFAALDDQRTSEVRAWLAALQTAL